MMKYWYNLNFFVDKSEIFQFKNDEVEMFSAYMQEVSLKVL